MHIYTCMYVHVSKLFSSAKTGAATSPPYSTPFPLSSRFFDSILSQHPREIHTHHQHDVLSCVLVNNESAAGKALEDMVPTPTFVVTRIVQC